jgi:hypothetical protein
MMSSKCLSPHPIHTSHDMECRFNIQVPSCDIHSDPDRGCSSHNTYSSLLLVKTTFYFLFIASTDMGWAQHPLSLLQPVKTIALFALTLKMEAACFSETPISTYKIMVSQPRMPQSKQSSP